MYYILSTYISVQIYTSGFRKAYMWSWTIAKVAGPPVCAKYTAKYETGEYQICELFLLFLSKILWYDDSILILDNTVYLNQANHTYLLASSMIQRMTERQLYIQDVMNVPSWSWRSSLSHGYGVVHTTPIVQSYRGQNLLLKEWQIWVSELVPLSVDEIDELSHKINENGHILKLLKCIEMWSSK